MEPNRIEIRIVKSLCARVRALGESESAGAVIEGVAVEYGQRSEDLGGFVEIIEPGAFGDLSGQDIIATAHHDVRQILGRTPDTLELDDDSKRLAYSIQIPDTQAGRDTRHSLERGDIRGSSFTFWVNGPFGGDGEVLEELEDGRILRRVKDATLVEVAPVVHPAYSQTSVEVAERSIALWRKDHPAIASKSETDSEQMAAFERRLEMMRL